MPVWLAILFIKMSYTTISCFIFINLIKIVIEIYSKKFLKISLSIFLVIVWLYTVFIVCRLLL